MTPITSTTRHDPDDSVLLPVIRHASRPVLLDRDDYARIAAREEFDFTFLTLGRYYGQPDVPRITVRPEFRDARAQSHVALPSMVLRPPSGFRAAYVNPMKPWDCTRRNLMIVPWAAKAPAASQEPQQ